jgi:hypothetical protein
MALSAKVRNNNHFTTLNPDLLIDLPLIKYTRKINSISRAGKINHTALSDPS